MPKVRELYDKVMGPKQEKKEAPKPKKKPKKTREKFDKPFGPTYKKEGK